MAGPEQWQCWSDSTHPCQSCGVQNPSPGTCAPEWAGKVVDLLIEIAASPRKQEGLPRRPGQADGRSVLEVG